MSTAYPITDNQPRKIDRTNTSNFIQIKKVVFIKLGIHKLKKKRPQSLDLKERKVGYMERGIAERKGKRESNIIILQF